MKKILFVLISLVVSLLIWSFSSPDSANVVDASSIYREAPVKGGKLVVSIPAEPPGLDPTIDASITTHRLVYANIFEGLARINRHEKLEPSLAESWTISRGGLVYTFRLHKGVRYHNGEKFNAGVARWNLNRLLAKGNNSHLKDITKIESPDTRTLIITLKEPNSLFLEHLGEGEALMLPKKGYGPATTYPIGTGPFKFMQWVRGDRLEIARFKGYRNKDLPYLDKVTFKFIANPKARLAALKTGKIDVVMGYSGSPKSALSLAQDKRFKILTGLSTGKVILSINNKAEPFNQLKIRRALAMAINRKKIVEAAMYGFGQPIGSHWSPVTPYYVDQTGLYPYNPEKARELLREAGFSNGFEAVLKLPSSYTYLQRTALEVSKMLGRIGISIDLKIIPGEKWNQQIFQNKNYQLAVNCHTDPWDIALYADPQNYMQYDSERFRQVYAKAITALNEKDKKKYFALCQRIIAEDAPAGFLFSMPILQVMKVGVMGCWKDYPTKAMDLTRVWLKRP